MQENFDEDELLSDLIVEPSTPSDKLENFSITVGNVPKLETFVRDISDVLNLHIKVTKFLRELLSEKTLSREASFIIQKHEYELFSPLKEIEDSFQNTISVLSKKTLPREIERKHNEIFPSEPTREHKKEFCKIKITFEYISTFLKIAIPAWVIFESRLKELKNNPETGLLEEKIKNNLLSKIKTLDKTTEEFLDKIKERFRIELTGSDGGLHEKLVSNIVYNPEENYSLNILLNIKESAEYTTDPKKTGEDIGAKILPQDANYKTRLIGTRDWNRNDSYVLEIKQIDLKKEYEKFDSSSFISLRPGEFDTPPSLASALVRKNSGHSQRQKYEQVIKTLAEFITTNLIDKDFPKATDDSFAFLYHIGPVVVYNTIVEDMNRRNFGHIFLVDKNSLLKIFPDQIVKYAIIGFWNETFMEMTPALADSYIHFSKGVQFVRSAYKSLYDQGAATRKGLTGISQGLDDYLKENAGKFFGYRRVQVFKRFVPNSIFGDLPDNNSHARTI